MAGSLIIDTLKSSTTGPTVFQNTSGVETGQLCRAWVRFTGSTGVTTGTFNVSSVTRNAASDYTVNFTNALPDTNYSFFWTCSNFIIPGNTQPVISTTSIRIYTGNSSSAAAVDPGTACVSIFR